MDSINHRTSQPTYFHLYCLGSQPTFSVLQVWYAAAAWGIHTAVAILLVRAMGLPTSLPWVELICYTGYVFVPACLTLLAGICAGAGVGEGGDEGGLWGQCKANW